MLSDFSDHPFLYFVSKLSPYAALLGLDINFLSTCPQTCKLTFTCHSTDVTSPGGKGNFNFV